MSIRKIGICFIFILIVCRVSGQQFVVTGGAKESLEAVDDSRERIKVFMVYGMDNVQISYTSTSTSHQWYRYKTRVSENSEPVESLQTGTSSVVTKIEEGYGYYVVDESVNIINRYYVWVIDYSKHEFNIRNLSVSPDVDQCMALRFTGDADMNDMVYYTTLGSQEIVKREFELSYETLEWDETIKQFSHQPFRQVFNTNPFSTSFSSPPLINTDITLSGDLFARHFGVEKSVSMPYKSVAIEVHADTTIVSSGSSSSGTGSDLGDGDLHAPTVVRFKAHANTPTASLFSWRIYKNDETNPIVDLNTDEFEYTFNISGTYTAKLEVSSAYGCSNEEDDESERNFIIHITDTEMVIPNAFSPGTTPGINDVFKVKYKSVVNFQGRIFNRWGNEIFHWTNPADGGDGRYRGQYVAAGAYHYMIEYTGTDGKKHMRKGDVNVFRSKSINTELPERE